VNKLDFYYISAKNFRCFGPDGIELDLRKLGPVIHIRGDNLDVEDEEERISSNGVGKSSLGDVIPYTLFGKTIQKKLKHGNLVNNKTGKKRRKTKGKCERHVLHGNTKDLSETTERPNEV